MTVDDAARICIRANVSGHQVPAGTLWQSLHPANGQTIDYGGPCVDGLERGLAVLSGCRQTRGHFGVLDKGRLVRTRHQQAQDMVHEFSL